MHYLNIVPDSTSLCDRRISDGNVSKSPAQQKDSEKEWEHEVLHIRTIRRAEKEREWQSTTSGVFWLNLTSCGPSHNASIHHIPGVIQKPDAFCAQPAAYRANSPSQSAQGTRDGRHGGLVLAKRATAKFFRIYIRGTFTKCCKIGVFGCLPPPPNSETMAQAAQCLIDGPSTLVPVRE